MKATALFPDGLRTDLTLNRPIVLSCLQRRCLSQIHLSTFISNSRRQYPVCRGQTLVCEPSGLGFLFKFNAQDYAGRSGRCAEEDASGSIAGVPSVPASKTGSSGRTT